jgi:hypothetical protein
MSGPAGQGYCGARASFDGLYYKPDKGCERNDLAVALYHLGDPAACRNVLEPLAKDAAKTDAAIREEQRPSDADSAVRLARATRTNLKLCEGKKS